MDERDNQSVDEASNQTIEVNDLEVGDAEAVKGGEKLPSPNLPISSPKPPRK